MQVPLRINFRNMDQPIGLEETIREKARELEQLYPRITACTVMVERRHHRHHKGDLFHVRIAVDVPGDELVVSRDPQQHKQNEDVRVAVHDAFHAARRRLEDHIRILQGATKTHAEPLLGVVKRLMPDERHGFLVTGDDREIYFHANSLAEGRFEDLKVGDDVRFHVEEGEGEKGEQASVVIPLHRRHGPPSSG